MSTDNCTFGPTRALWVIPLKDAFVGKFSSNLRHNVLVLEIKYDVPYAEKKEKPYELSIVLGFNDSECWHVTTYNKKCLLKLGPSYAQHLSSEDLNLARAIIEAVCDKK